MLPVKKNVQIKLIKSLLTLNISAKTRRHLKLVGIRPEKMHGSCKVNRKSADGYPPFRAILSALQTPTYKPAKFLVSSLEPLTTNKYTVKDSPNFAIENVDQDLSNFFGSLTLIHC